MNTSIHMFTVQEAGALVDNWRDELDQAGIVFAHAGRANRRVACLVRGKSWLGTRVQMIDEYYDTDGTLGVFEVTWGEIPQDISDQDLVSNDRETEKRGPIIRLDRKRFRVIVCHVDHEAAKAPGKSAKFATTALQYSALYRVDTFGVDANLAMWRVFDGQRVANYETSAFKLCVDQFLESINLEQPCHKRLSIYRQ